MSEADSQNLPGTVSGRYVVIGMFLFGFAMVGALWLYWEMYTSPYRDLQNAINAEFPGSSPRAIGGKARSHEEGSPSILRIVIQVDYDPNTDEARSHDIAARLAELAQEHHDVTQYELLEIHLVERVPEDSSRQWSVSKPVKEWFPEPAT